MIPKINQINSRFGLCPGQHAREWIAPAIATYVAQQLAEEKRWYLKMSTWFITPLVNADGYEYSIHTDRYWRKNRRVTSESNCVGVDINRNWGKEWGNEASKSDYCSEEYRGATSFSEKETIAYALLLHYFTPEVKIQLQFYNKDMK